MLFAAVINGRHARLAGGILNPQSRQSRVVFLDLQGMVELIGVAAVVVDAGDSGIELDGFGVIGDRPVEIIARGNTVFEYLQEVQVKTSGISAEYGGALGGVISAVTQSGGNTFRGEGHYYFQGSALAAGPVKRLNLDPVDDKTFTIKMKQAYGPVLFSLASSGGQLPAIMREKEASTDPNTAITETIGSGPWKFNKAEWAPGAKTVYDKFADYKPRTEPTSGLAGAKIVKVDRMEWVVLPDNTTAANALGLPGATAAEIQFLTSLTTRVFSTDPLPYSGVMSMPITTPFDCSGLTRSTATWVQPPGAAPRSTTRAPRLRNLN
mgnify:CR=1 FL=1